MSIDACRLRCLGLAGCLALLEAHPADAVSLTAAHDWNVGSQEWRSLQGVEAALRADSQGGGHTEGWIPLLIPAGGGALSSSASDAAPGENLFAGSWHAEAVGLQPAATLREPAPSPATESGAASSAFPAADASAIPPLPSSLPIFAPHSWPVGGGPSRFTERLASANWIGGYGWEPRLGPAEHRLNNGMLTVPEPSEYAMIAAALLAVSLALRLRRGRPPAGGGAPPQPAGGTPPTVRPLP